jgi:hypothetical protein
MRVSATTRRTRRGDSPSIAGRRKEFVAGLIDGGEFTVTLNYVPGSATDLAADRGEGSRDTRKIRIVIPDESGTGAADWNMVTQRLRQEVRAGPHGAGRSDHGDRDVPRHWRS